MTLALDAGAVVLVALAVVLALGAEVVHELGHALTAFALGYDVDVYLHGGTRASYASNDVPDDVRRVALWAGPLTNIGVGAALGVAAVLVAHPLARLALLGAGACNCALGVDNLLSADPLSDGAKLRRMKGD